MSPTERTLAGGPLLARPAPSGDVGELVARLRGVPDEHRRFAVDARTAMRLHRIGPPLLEELGSAGLPCAGRGTQRLHDGYDLANAALHLGLTSVQRRAIRSWAAALRAGAPGQEPEYRVEFTASCPVPGHAGPCRYGVLLPGGRTPVLAPGPGETPLATVTVRPRTRWPELPDAVVELLGTLDPVGFFMLPEALRWDPEFLWRTRMADCGGAAAWLVAEGTRRGLAVRFGFGLLVAKPYSTPHCWAEFLVDGVWVPVDPLLVRAMAAWGGLDAAAHGPRRSPGALFHRLTGHFTKVVSHGGVWAPTSLPTERTPCP
ncbi:transglutaminase domain-containing protein [Streptomyces gamaensis]|uniref:Transglutaminase domain-containing protein n=1 Tax=Streptomyces gamaensis TaxID=1763542 RepID=A0ABW0YYM9_9ACTN